MESGVDGAVPSGHIGLSISAKDAMQNQVSGSSPKASKPFELSSGAPMPDVSGKTGAFNDGSLSLDDALGLRYLSLNGESTSTFTQTSFQSNDSKQAHAAAENKDAAFSGSFLLPFSGPGSGAMPGSLAVGLAPAPTLETASPTGHAGHANANAPTATGPMQFGSSGGQNPSYGSAGSGPLAPNADSTGSGNSSQPATPVAAGNNGPSSHAQNGSYGPGQGQHGVAPAAPPAQTPGYGYGGYGGYGAPPGGPAPPPGGYGGPGYGPPPPGEHGGPGQGYGPQHGPGGEHGHGGPYQAYGHPPGGHQPQGQGPHGGPGGYGPPGPGQYGPPPPGYGPQYGPHGGPPLPGHYGQYGPPPPGWHQGPPPGYGSGQQQGPAQGGPPPGYGGPGGPGPAPPGGQGAAPQWQQPPPGAWGGYGPHYGNYGPPPPGYGGYQGPYGPPQGHGGPPPPGGPGQAESGPAGQGASGPGGAPQAPSGAISPTAGQSSVWVPPHSPTAASTGQHGGQGGQGQGPASGPAGHTGPPTLVTSPTNAGGQPGGPWGAPPPQAGLGAAPGPAGGPGGYGPPPGYQPYGQGPPQGQPGTPTAGAWGPGPAAPSPAGGPPSQGAWGPQGSGYGSQPYGQQQGPPQPQGGPRDQQQGQGQYGPAGHDGGRPPAQSYQHAQPPAAAPVPAVVPTGLQAAGTVVYPVSGPAQGDDDAYGRMHMPIDARAINSGQDTRTTIMVKNVPSRMTQLLLVEELAVAGFGGSFDFVYVPVDFRSNCCMGYAFINFTSAREILPFAQRWAGRRWPQFSSRKRCELAYARIQGRDSLEEHFKSSRTLLSSPPHCRPLLLPSPGEADRMGPVSDVVHAPVEYPDPHGVAANTYPSPTGGAFTLYLHGETSGSVVVRASLAPPTPIHVRQAQGHPTACVVVRVAAPEQAGSPRAGAGGGRSGRPNRDGGGGGGGSNGRPFQRQGSEQSMTSMGSDKLVVQAGTVPQSPGGGRGHGHGGHFQRDGHGGGRDDHDHRGSYGGGGYGH